MLLQTAALLTDISGYATHAAFHDAFLEQGVCGVADLLGRGAAGHCAFGKERLDVTACVIYPLYQNVMLSVPALGVGGAEGNGIPALEYSLLATLKGRFKS